MHGKLNWGAVSAGTWKIMIPGHALTLGLLQDLPAFGSRGVCLWAHERLSDSSELSRALPWCSSCAIASAPSQNSRMNAGEPRWREGGAGWTCCSICDVKHEALFVL